MCVDGGLNDPDGALWCFDESNKKIYNIVMKTHLRRGGHETKLSFNVTEEVHIPHPLPHPPPSYTLHIITH